MSITMDELQWEADQKKKRQLQHLYSVEMVKRLVGTNSLFDDLSVLMCFQESQTSMLFIILLCNMCGVAIKEGADAHIPTCASKSTQETECIALLGQIINPKLQEHLVTVQDRLYETDHWVAMLHIMQEIIPIQESISADQYDDCEQNCQPPKFDTEE